MMLQLECRLREVEVAVVAPRVSVLQQSVLDLQALLAYTTAIQARASATTPSQDGEELGPEEEGRGGAGGAEEVRRRQEEAGGWDSKGEDLAAKQARHR